MPELASPNTPPQILASGDSAVVVEFGDRIDAAVNAQVYAFADLLSASAPSWLVEIVPTYRSLLLQYDPLAVGIEEVRAALEPLIGRSASGAAAIETRSQQRRVFELPVAYGDEYGPDLATVAEHNSISAEEVIRIHSSIAYPVYMIGFAPGFPYLGGMDARIACPRLKTPRTRVPAGSVGIAESQTGVYPNASPGGWQLIGRTPVRLFDAAQEPPSVLQPGHLVRFVPVSPEEFAAIEAQVAAGTYVITSSEAAEG